MLRDVMQHVQLFKKYNRGVAGVEWPIVNVFRCVCVCVCVCVCGVLYVCFLLLTIC